MPRLRKLLLNRHAVFLTSTIEEGLPLPPNPLINSILESALARAQHLHPIRISHMLFESNHFHMLAIVDNPNDIKGFMERFKTESAHAVNKLLGRRKRTIWCKGYDSPLVLTLEDAISRIAYIYTNPAKDFLVRSINDYPGISSWKSFCSRKQVVKSCPWIRRSMLFALKRRSLSRSQAAGLARVLAKKATTAHSLTVSPNAWMEAFGITEPEDVSLINKEIAQSVMQQEASLERERLEEGRRVMGAERLVLQPMDAEHVPQSEGRKMWCICRDRELRRKFIRRVKELVESAREVLRRWEVGDFSVPFPAGLFPPCMPKLVEPLCIY